MEKLKINTGDTNKLLKNFPNCVIQYFTDDKKNNSNATARTSVSFDSSEASVMQKKNCGVFFSINGFRDGKRIKENLVNINAIFVDIDVAKEKENLPKIE